eukprot:c21337_g1_i1.p1 GENE.c21337_g1_i1~~c21337_g1_i1.p1  ORF type:complete len:200 (-),score=85.87 c21337_g1_i1:7-606(-)
MFRLRTFAERLQNSSLRNMSTSAAAQDSKAADPAWFEGGRLFFRWAFVPCGLVTSGIFVHEGLQGLAFSEASLVPGVLETSTATITQAGSNSDGSPSFKFIYKYKGKDFVSSRVVPGAIKHKVEEHQAKWNDKYRVGTTHTVFVYPSNPELGFLEPGPRPEYFTVTAVGALFAYGLIKSFRYTRNLSLQQLTSLGRVGK